MKKLSKTVDGRTYRHGQWYRAIFDGTKSVGKISIDGDGRIYLCQNIMDGKNTNDKLGFEYSWCVDSGSDNDLHYNDIENLVLLSRKPSSFKIPLILPSVGSYKVRVIEDGEDEAIQVGCTPVSRELYLEIGRKVGWIE